MLIDADCVQDACKQLRNFRAWSPYRYGGVWFLAQINETEVVCFRTKQTVVKHLLAANVVNIEIWKAGG